MRAVKVRGALLRPKGSVGPGTQNHVMERESPGHLVSKKSTDDD